MPFTLWNAKHNTTQAANCIIRGMHRGTYQLYLMAHDVLHKHVSYIDIVIESEIYLFC